jgi:hypothetical protein
MVVGCVVPTEPVDDGLASAAELWTGAYDPGPVSVGPVVVTSPRTATGGAFYAQDPGGGPGTGLRIDLGGFVSGAPPAMGVEVELVGSWHLDEGGGPVVVVNSADAIVDIDATADVVASPWSGDPTSLFGVVSLTGATVASMPDPTGRALLDSGQDLVGSFAFATPGYGSSGDLVGVAVEAGGIALRSAADWDGEIRSDPPVDATIDQVRDGSFSDGTPVALSGLQSAPWSVDGRWTAVQDDQGDGLWIDGESWGIAGSPEGTSGTWTGEVRTGSDGLRLRTWTPPRETGVGTPITGSDPVDGARIAATVTGLGPVDAFGDRPADGFALDDRFDSLDALIDGVVVTGIVHGDGPELRIAPFAW